MSTLVVFKKDWADEFDCESYFILPESLDRAKELVLGTINPDKSDDDDWGEYSFYFGTNEGWEEGELTLDDFEFIEITPTEEHILVKLLGNDFGTGFKGL